MIVRILNTITVACRDYPVSPTHTLLCCLNARRVQVNWQQQTVNTDQDEDWALTRTPSPTTPKKVLCCHGDQAKARASHCWARSSGVSNTPSQRSDVSEASHLGHHLPGCCLWPQQTLKQIEMGEKGEKGERAETHLLNKSAWAHDSWEYSVCFLCFRPFECSFVVQSSSTLHVSVSPSCGEV